ncbi:MAG: DUF2917 domain-containing protein [Acidovorax sp.]
MPSHDVPASAPPVGSASPIRPASLPAGCWKLQARRALSLRPRRPGVLAIAQGRAWVTLTGASQATPADHVLHAGDRLSLLPGQHAVIEAWGLPGAVDAAAALAFRWDCAPPVASSAAFAPLCTEGAAAVVVCWDRAVAQPLRELRLALRQGGCAVAGAAADAAGAIGRLVLGLARFAAYRVAGARPRRLARP